MKPELLTKLGELQDRLEALHSAAKQLDGAAERLAEVKKASHEAVQAAAGVVIGAEQLRQATMALGDMKQQVDTILVSSRTIHHELVRNQEIAQKSEERVTRSLADATAQLSTQLQALSTAIEQIGRTWTKRYVLLLLILLLGFAGMATGLFVAIRH